MSEAPQRRWLRLLARVLSVALTAIVVLAVGQMLSDEYQHGADTDWSELPDKAKKFVPWLIGLRRALPLVLLASVLCATYAVFRSTGRDLRRMLWAAFAGFLVFAAGIAGFYVLFVYWYVPAAFPPPDLTNKPGTLISLGQTTPDVAFTTLDGRAVHFGDLRGRVVLLNFFATWSSAERNLPRRFGHSASNMILRFRWPPTRTARCIATLRQRAFPART